MPIIAEVFVLEVNQSKEETLELMQKKKKAKNKQMQLRHVRLY